MCVYSDLSCHICLVFWDFNWTIRNKKVGSIGYCLYFCLWRVWIGLWAMILVVCKKRIWCIDLTVLFHGLFWWVGTSFCDRRGMFSGGILGWFQSRLYICVVVVQLLVYVLLLVIHIGGWIWWFLLGTHRHVLFVFCEYIVLAEVSKVIE